jgi:DNA replication protein DnaC
VPFNKIGSELLFIVISDCYEKHSVIITTNLGFGQLSSIFGDTKITAALIDKLAHRASIFSFPGESNRLVQALNSKK